MDRLTHLLQRYKNNTATKAEKEELSALLEKNLEDNINKTPQLTEQQEERVRMRYQHIIASPQRKPAKTIRLSSSWPWMAAAAAIILTVVSFVVMMKDDSFTGQPLQELADTRVVHSGKQQAELVELPDGTKVILNKNSELSYDSATFGVSTREVTLTGEAYFDVTHDATKRFVVKTGDVSTQVLGTAFNVSAYPGQEEIKVTVERGLVQVGDNKKVYGKVKPNEQIAVNVETHAFIQRNVIAEEVIEWQTDFFILDYVTFAEAALKIEKRFNVKVIISNDSLKNCKVNAWFLNHESLKDIIEGLSLIKQATAVIHSDSIVIDGGQGCKN